jgi:hypothetical protein
MTLRETLESLTVDQLKQRLALIPAPRRPTRKADLIDTLNRYLLSDALSAVVARLPDLELSAVAEAAHTGQGALSLDGFKAKYGSLPDLFTRNPYDWYGYDRKKKRESGLELLFYQGRIPEDLATALKPLVPEPAELVLTTLDDEQLPETVFSGDDEPETLRRTDNELRVRQELPAMLRLAGQGGIAVGAKTGLPSAAAIRRIEALLLDGDWYDEDDDLALQRWAGGSIRPIRAFAWPLLLQTGGLAKVDGSKLVLTAKGRKALSRPFHEVVSELYKRWLSKGAPDELRRVDMIKGQTSKGVRLTAPVDRRLVIEDALLNCCPLGEWLSVDDLFRGMKVYGHRFEVAGNPWKLYLTDPQYGSLGYSGSDDFEILEARYTLAYLFEYLATLGIIDIAYSLPYAARPDYTDLWGTDELAFLSRYDGLRFLRLNDLGAYCLGLSETYIPRLLERPPLFAVEPGLTLVLRRAAEPDEHLQLEQIASSPAADRWRLDAEAMLKLAADADERARIRAFMETCIDGEPPTELSDLLDGIEQRATALTDAGPARLIQCRDAALAGLLSSDPATAAHCSRAGERHLCVMEKKLGAFRKGIARLGFVLPELSP